MSDTQYNKYSQPELACYRSGNVQYIPPAVVKGSREYNEIVQNAEQRGFEVKELPTD